MIDSWSYFSWAAKVPTIHQLDHGLNALGAEGWELVTSVSTVKSWINLTGNDIVLIFKKAGPGLTPSPEALTAVSGFDPDTAY